MPMSTDDRAPDTGSVIVTWSSLIRRADMTASMTAGKFVSADGSFAAPTQVRYRATRWAMHFQPGPATFWTPTRGGVSRFSWPFSGQM